MDRSRYEELMVKVVDATASAIEREELMSHVANNPELSRELEQHQALSAISQGWVKRLDADLTEDRLQSNAVVRLVGMLAAALVVVGVTVLTFGGFIAPLYDSDAPLWLRLGLFTMGAGTALGVVWAIYYAITSRKNDPYKAVIR